MYDGYLELGGNEIVNSKRVADYVANNAPSIALRDCTDCEGVGEAIGDGQYQSPKDDDAPWFDPTNPATADFYGVYSLGAEGVTDSTWSASVTESLGPGGTVSAGRHGTRTMRWHVMLVAGTKLALEAGFTWLKAALLPGDCSGGCGGEDMCYFLACPDICRRWNFNSGGAGSSFRYVVDPETTERYTLRYPSPGPLFRGSFGGVAESVNSPEGQVMRWGATEADDDRVEVESYGPVTMRRTNVVPDPSFEHGGGDWLLPYPGIIPTGGADGGAYVASHISPTKQNFIADPSLETYTPAELGWEPFEPYAPDGVRPTRELAIDAPDGEYVASVVAGAGTPGPPGEGTIWNAFTIPLVGRAFADVYDGHLGIMAKGEGSLLFGIFDESDGTVFSSYPPIALDDPAVWQQVDAGIFNLPEGDLTGYRLLVAWLSATTPTAPLLLDEVGVVSTNGDDYGWFSGASPADGLTQFRWQMGTPLGASDQYEISNLASAINSPVIVPVIAGENTLTLDLRSEQSGTVTVYLWDADYDEVASAVFELTPEWTRYGFTADVPAAGVIIGVSTGFEPSIEYDVDRVQLEAGHLQLPFLSGDTPWEEAAEGYIVGGWPTDEYTVTWAGEDHARSASVMVWNGQMTFGQKFGAVQPGDPWLEGDGGLCDAYAFVETLQGRRDAWGGYGVVFELTPAEQAVPYSRTMHDVSTTTGARVISDVPVQNGYMREVEFFLTAGIPFGYSDEQLVIEAPFSALPTHLWGEDQCPVVELPDIVDPDCPAPPAPPRPPEIVNSCVLTETQWRRTWVEIPAAAVSMWSETAPKIEITSGENAIREVRARVFRNPFNREIDAWGRENLMENPRATMPISNPWAITMGTGGIAVLEQSTTGPWAFAGVPEDITTAARARWTTVPTAGSPALSVRSPLGSITPGKTYHTSVFAGWEDSTSGFANLRLRMTYLDAGGGTVSSKLSPVAAVGGANPAWREFEVDLLAPATANYVRLSIEYTGGTTPLPQVNDAIVGTGALLQEIPQDGDVPLIGRNAFYYMDFLNLPPDTALDNITVEGGDENQTSPYLQLQFGGAGGAADMLFVIPGLVAGKTYAMRLDGINGGNSTSVLSYGALAAMPSVSTGPFNPISGALTGGVFTAGGPIGAFALTVDAATATSMTIFGISIWEVHYSDDYFDGSSPAGGGSYYQWTDAVGHSTSYATAGINIDPCDWCSEFILSYMPAQTTLSVDAVWERAFASVKGGPEQSADTLLYGSDGGPMSWPALTCNIPYLLAIDVPSDYVDDVSIKVSLSLREV